MERRKRNLLTLGAIALALGLFAVLGIFQTQKADKQVAMATEAPLPKEGLPTIGGKFDLVDKEGKAWKETDFKGKPMLVYFGYAYCPDVCPKALSHMSDAVAQLGGGAIIQPLFITVDPNRDTKEHLKSFSQNFHKDFVMLTGEKPQVDQALKAYKVHAAKTTDEEGQEYLMDHSSLIYLMDREGKYRAHFNHETPAHDIVKRVKHFLEKGE